MNYMDPSLLDSNADKIIPNYDYVRRLSEDELDAIRRELANDSVELNRLEEEKKESDAAFKEMMKPFKGRVSAHIHKLKSKSESVTEDVYLIFDQEDKRARIYNSDGNLIHERPLYAEERQGNIFNMAERASNQ